MKSQNITRLFAAFLLLIGAVGMAAAQADGSAAGPQAVPRKGCRRTTDDPTRPGRAPCRWPFVPARYPTAARASGPPATAPRVFPGGPTSAMPRRAVRAQPPAPSPSRRSGPPAGFEPSLAARSPSLRRLSLKPLDRTCGDPLDCELDTRQVRSSPYLRETR